MHDAVPQRKLRTATHIESWMIDLLEDDRPGDHVAPANVSQGLDWLYLASIVRSN